MDEQGTAPYEFYQKVWVVSPDPKCAAIRGKEGAIVGRAQAEDGQWYYAVHMYSSGKSWHLAHNELEPSGEFDRHESFHDGTSIRVRVDERGRGRIVDDE